MSTRQQRVLLKSISCTRTYVCTTSLKPLLFFHARFKLIKWWCQSFLVGIGTVVAGFRDDTGVVESVAEYPVREIPR